MTRSEWSDILWSRTGMIPNKLGKLVGGQRLTYQLAESLRRSIRLGEYAPGDPIPSERQLTEAMSLSRVTVRRAIEVLVREGVLYRVPGAGTFVGLSRSAPAMQATLGLIVPTLANPFFGELSDAIEAAARERGFQLLVGRSEFNPSDEAAYLDRYADNPSVKGVLVVPTTGELPTAAYRRLAERQMPFVFVARATDALEADVVATDHVRGAREVVRHLLEQGHWRIAFVGSVRPQPSTHLRGYREALQEAGIEFDPALVVTVDADADEAGPIGMRQLLERGVSFTAVFARIDATAFGAMRTLREAGLRIPADVSVAGFDNTQLAAHVEPGLTTVDHTLKEIGRLSVSLLLDRVEGRYGGPARSVVIQPKLVVRGSSGPAPAAGSLPLIAGNVSS